MRANYHKWTTSEQKFIREHYLSLTDQQIAYHLGIPRSSQVASQRSVVLGLKKQRVY